MPRPGSATGSPAASQAHRAHSQYHPENSSSGSSSSQKASSSSNKAPSRSHTTASSAQKPDTERTPLMSHQVDLFQPSGDPILFSSGLCCGDNGGRFAVSSGGHFKNVPNQPVVAGDLIKLFDDHPNSIKTLELTFRDESGDWAKEEEVSTLAEVLKDVLQDEHRHFELHTLILKDNFIDDTRLAFILAAISGNHRLNHKIKLLDVRNISLNDTKIFEEASLYRKSCPKLQIRVGIDANGAKKLPKNVQDFAIDHSAQFREINNPSKK